jgi:hypothetical protein
MSVATPDWLSRREGELRPSADGRSWSVSFDGALQYVLVAVPAEGKFACRISQTVNGKRLDAPGVYDTAEDAARAGLEHLRQQLGW